MNRLSCLLAVIVAVIGTGIAAHARPTYDLAADFGTTTNPNGAWRYAFSQTLGGNITLLNTTFNDAGSARGWRSTQINSLGTPVVYQNQSTSSFLGTAPGAIAFHPGPDGSIAAFTLIRFVAPTTDTYTIAAQFFAGDSGNTDAYILRNSLTGSALFSTTSTNTSPSYNQSVSLTAGDTLDFIVGTGGDNYFADTTPINIRITNNAVTVPEANTATLFTLSGSLIGLGTLIIRRKRA